MTKYKIIRSIVQELGYPNYRFGQIADAIFKQKVERYADMAQIPKDLRAALSARLGDSVSGFETNEHIAARQTDKTLFVCKDGAAAETVALRYRKGWNSFCISSQCGCACGCKFCATGGMGFIRDLTADEITDQLLFFLRSGRRLDSVSFMGMGEPLLNSEVFAAISDLTDPALFGLSQRRITLSTVGIVHGIKQMTARFPKVNLAFSLHAPTDELRREIMPVDDRYPISDVFAALDAHIIATNRRVFLAYVMLDGVNDGNADARALASLINSHVRCKHLYRVDLIPYNATPDGRFEPSKKARIAAFCDELRKHGVAASVRTQFGSEVNAACGQLAVETENLRFS